MVVESLLAPLKAEKKPWKLFFLGFLYTTLAMILSLWIFRDQASLTTVFFIVMASIPLVYNTLKIEEGKDLVIESERNLLHEHNKAIVFLMYLFVGITVASTFWYVSLPYVAQVLSILASLPYIGWLIPEIPSNSHELLFERQLETIANINGAVATGNVVNHTFFLAKIFFNNVQVLAFAILFAFLFGAGAIFILTWNATVIAAAMGSFIRINIESYASTIGFLGANSYSHIVSIGLLKYALHGLPEIAAYFYGGVAGSILSVAIIRKHYESKHFGRIMMDFSELVMIALGFLVVSAFLEVFVTPVLF